MQIGAFVLHLPIAEKRRANAHSLRDKCSLACEIWPAVDGSKQSSADISAVVRDHMFDPPNPFALTASQIGCFLSHRQIWAEIIRRGIPAAFIIEDNAEIDPQKIKSALNLSAENIDQLDYIRFETHAPSAPKVLIESAGGCALTEPQFGGLGTMAQMVSQRAAQHLLEMSKTIDRPVDTFIQSHWHTGLRPASIFPSGVLEIGETADGPTKHGGKKSLFEKLRREWSRRSYFNAVKRLSRHSEAPREGGLND